MGALKTAWLLLTGELRRLECRRDELLVANNDLVERRREAERKFVRALHAAAGLAESEWRGRRLILELLSDLGHPLVDPLYTDWDNLFACLRKALKK